MKKLKILLLCLLVSTSISFVKAQTGTLKGKIYDSITKEYISFAKIEFEKKGKIIYERYSDNEGNFTFKNIPIGIYNIKIYYPLYEEFIIKKISIIKDKVTYQDFVLIPVIQIPHNHIMEYKVPLFDGG